MNIKKFAIYLDSKYHVTASEEVGKELPAEIKEALAEYLDINKINIIYEPDMNDLVIKFNNRNVGSINQEWIEYHTEYSTYEEVLRDFKDKIKRLVYLSIIDRLIEDRQINRDTIYDNKKLIANKMYDIMDNNENFNKKMGMAFIELRQNVSIKNQKSL